jgi:hypothetical protein
MSPGHPASPELSLLAIEETLFCRRRQLHRQPTTATSSARGPFWSLPRCELDAIALVQVVECRRGTNSGHVEKCVAVGVSMNPKSLSRASRTILFYGSVTL